MNTLKPCPFCPDGGDVQLVTFPSGVDDVVHCHTCDRILKHKIWQTRPIEDDLRKRIAELEALVNVSEGLYERIYEQAARIAELEGKIDQLTAHSDIERQDDKWIPEVQE